MTTAIVSVIKNGKVHISSNYRLTINKELSDDNYQMPHTEDIITKSEDGNYYCKLDGRSAYFHALMDDTSADLQKLNIHIGLFRVLRLMFGVKVAPKIFQLIMCQLLHYFKGISVFYDDIKIQGKTIEEVLSISDFSQKWYQIE